MELHNHFQFGPFYLNASERVLLREGRVVPLAPKALKTLLVLVRNMGHVVEKDVLMAEVWPDEFVEEGNLTQHIFMLRKALGEDPGKPSYIETIPRRGYRFVAQMSGPGTASQAKAISNEQKERLARHQRDNTEAHEHYQKGRYFWSKFTRGSLEQAVVHFLQALRLDPYFTQAYAGIVDCYLRLATDYLPPAEPLPGSATALGTGNETLSESQKFDRIRQEWDRKILQSELHRAEQLKLGYPTVYAWHSAYQFSLSLYNQSRMKKGQPSVAPSAPELPLAPTESAGEFPSSSPTRAEEVQVFCMIAREQIVTGNYEAAGAMLQRWRTMDEWPGNEGLSSHSFADLLLTAGSVAGYVASTRQVKAGHKHAQALLNGAIGLFEQLRLRTRAAEARIELAWCSYREGLFDMARSTLLAALETLSDEDEELRTVALIRLSLVDVLAGRLQDALAHLDQAARLVEEIGPLVAGRYNLQRGMTLRNLASAENRKDYFKPAIEHYQKALCVFEALGNHRHTATLEGNCGYLLLRLERLDEAEVHLVHARNLIHALGDNVRGAQIDDALGQLHLATGRFDLAEKSVVEAIKILEKSGHESFLAEALTTLGQVLCKLGRHREAKRVLDRARQTAERCGDNEGAAHAVLTEIEEMCDQLDDDERLELGGQMDRFLAHSQKASTLDRLRKCRELIADARACE